MLHGKKGFERLVWAAKNVLNNSMTWLFCDLTAIPSPHTPTPSSDEPSQIEPGSKPAPSPTPISKHAPIQRVVTPTTTHLKSVLIPPLIPLESAPKGSTEKELVRLQALELSEWLALVVLGSPRIQSQDEIDPYLSRYEVPGSDEKLAKNGNVVLVRWRGFLPVKWVEGLWLSLL